LAIETLDGPALGAEGEFTAYESKDLEGVLFFNQKKQGNRLDRRGTLTINGIEYEIARRNHTSKNGKTFILDGDMRDLLTAAKKERCAYWLESPWVFSRQGEPIKDFRRLWDEACKHAGVPDLNFHDLRRIAVRNMRRDGIP
jgi:integrase